VAYLPTQPSFVNAIDHGADPTGTTDSTAAIEAALAVGVTWLPKFIPNTTTGAVYIINNMIPPNGSTLIGEGALGYVGGGVASDLTMFPRIVGTATGAQLINAATLKGFYCRGVRFDGSNSSTPRSCNGVTYGGITLMFEDCIFEYLNYGIGGTVAGQSNPYTWISFIKNCHMSTNNNGIGDLVDSWVLYSELSNNIENGILFNSGDSSKTTLLGNRYEWNGRTANGGTGYGLNLTNAGAIQIVGGEFDANGQGGIYINGSDWITITGVEFERNGANVTSGTTLISTSSHIEFNDAYNVQITGCQTRDISDGIVYCPAHCVAFDGSGGNNGTIVFSANDLSGYQGSTAGATLTGPTSSNTTWYSGTFPTGTGLAGMVVSKNFGTGLAADDIDTR
jgi:hypothetical protein